MYFFEHAGTLASNGTVSLCLLNTVDIRSLRGRNLRYCATVISAFTGTRIIYDRKFLLQMRNSPLSKTPPAKLATIPDIVNEEVIESDPVKITTPDVEGSNKRHEGTRPQMHVSHLVYLYVPLALSCWCLQTTISVEL